MATETSKVRQSVSVANTTAQPLSLSLAKLHLRLPPTANASDPLIAELINAATYQVEHDCQTLLISRAVTEKFSDWPTGCDIDLYWRPVVSITSVKYYDTSGTQQTISSANYSLNAYGRRIVWNDDYTLPTVDDRWDAIEVIYQAGYGADNSVMPADLLRMVRLRVGYDFENPDMLANDQVYTEQAYERLVDRYMRSTYP